MSTESIAEQGAGINPEPGPEPELLDYDDPDAKVIAADLSMEYHTHMFDDALLCGGL